jgi:hypothetical protein
MTATSDWRKTLLAGLGLACLTASCALPRGMNDDCQWPAEQRFPLDLTDRSHASHLRADVKVAEELGVRYDDTRLARGPAPEGRPKSRDECDARLFGEVAALHSIDLRAVLNARELLNSERPEAVVYLPLVLLYAGVAFAAASRISARFDWANEKVPLLVVGTLVSVGIGAALAGSGHLWGGLVEMARMGNTHMTYRAHRLGWKEFAPYVFLLGVASVWASMLVRSRTTRRVLD